MNKEKIEKEQSTLKKIQNKMNEKRKKKQTETKLKK